MQSTVFREYDIRGKIGTEFILDQVYDLTNAIIQYFRSQQASIRRVAVGMDGRTHSPIIKDAMTHALRDAGIDVLFIGICPSPVLYFTSHTQQVDAGLMITASHNPKDYNGIKILLGTHVVWGAAIQEIRAIYEAKQSIDHSVITPGNETYEPMIPAYVDWLSEHFAHLQTVNFPILLDAGHGACAAVLPLLLERFSWADVTMLCMKVDGSYPRHEADPTQEKNMQDLQKKLSGVINKQVIAVGFDGDGDRLGALTHDGHLIPGDMLLTLFAQQVLEKSPGVPIVYDVKASDVVPMLIKQWGGIPIIAPAGHAIIKDYMKKYDAALAGELSGHFFFHDRYFGYDDAIYAFLRLVELVHHAGTSLKEILKIIPKRLTTPEFRIPCPDDRKQSIVAEIAHTLSIKNNGTIETIDGVRITYDHGWALIRVSNTQPALSLRIEADTASALQDIIYEWYALLQPYNLDGMLREWYQAREAR